MRGGDLHEAAQKLDQRAAYPRGELLGHGSGIPTEAMNMNTEQFIKAVNERRQIRIIVFSVVTALLMAVSVPGWSRTSAAADLNQWLVPAAESAASLRVLPPPPPPPPPFGTVNSVMNDIPPRYQWNANSGYCGEVSMISAGLYYGQYLSQFDVRAIASPGKPQNRVDAQLLLGVNDAATARRLRLKFKRVVTANNGSFYAWVKHQLMNGYPVITAVFNNEYLLYGDSRAPDIPPRYHGIIAVLGDMVRTQTCPLYSDGRTAIRPRSRVC